MDWSTVAAVAAGIVLFVATLNALPRLWEWLKGFFGFARGIEKVKDLPALKEGQDKILSMLDPEAAKAERAEVKQAIRDFDEALSNHMIEEERLRKEEGAMVEKVVTQFDDLRRSLSEFSVESARTAFRHSVIAADEAYYEVVKEGGAWVLAWVNRAFIELTGMELHEAKVDQYRAIHENDRIRVKAMVDYSTEHDEPLKVEFRNVNVRTKEQTTVEIYALPVRSLDGDVVSFFGVVRSLEDTELGLLAAMESRASAVFRQTAQPSDIAYYEMVLIDPPGEWELAWANNSWEELTGLSWVEAKRSFWSVVDDVQAPNITPEVLLAAEEGSVIDITFDLINDDTGLRTMVRMVGYPVFSTRGKTTGYFGSLSEVN